MVPLAIFSFLTGAVLARAFRVWILVPLSLLILIVASLAAWAFDLNALIGPSMILGVQTGYACGLIVWRALASQGEPAETKAKQIPVSRSTYFPGFKRDH
ncbi:hypothetical protein C2U70_27155 [Bradyrhizobium guangdongense]|uniref:hypothetical protein n=1 Tax=Bradyrhizobium guangdongense TaxID=1325090 RepID=UPI00112AEF05|nr:hypothetical protein [Bradyrhizobium guangdongense]TPQ30223.1 hypothetical protein C2U70_27155 [Bradyrhizobium guangdongense]